MYFPLYLPFYFRVKERDIDRWVSLPICYFIVIQIPPNSNCKQFFSFLSAQFLFYYEYFLFLVHFTAKQMEDQRISANTNKYSNVYSSAVEISAQMRPLSQGRFQLLLRSVFAHFIEAPTCFRFRFRFWFFFLFSSRLSRFFIVALLLCFCVVLFYFFFFWQITLINYFYQSGKWGQWQLLAVVPISPICLGLVCQLTIRFFSRAHSLVPLPCLCLSSLLFYVILFCM